MNESKLKKLKQVLIALSTATFMSNKFKNLLLDPILTLDCCCDNMCYFYFLNKKFLENKKPSFCSVKNCEKDVRPFKKRSLDELRASRKTLFGLFP